LILVHGGCHGAWCWEGVQESLAELGWASTAFDWYSHGDSRQLEESEWLKRDILAVREEISIVADQLAARTDVPSVVVGHSMGGLAALSYAASTQNQLAGLVLLAPVVPEGFAEGVSELPVQPGSPWGPPPPEVARQMFYSGVEDAQADVLYGRLQSESPEAVWQATRYTAQVDVSAITAPVLVFAGDLDPLVPPAAIRRLAETMGAHLVSLPGAGHGLTLDPVSSDVSRAMDDWLRDPRGSGVTVPTAK